MTLDGNIFNDVFLSPFSSNTPLTPISKMVRFSDETKILDIVRNGVYDGIFERLNLTKIIYHQ